MITHLSIEVTHNQINATTSEDSYAIVDQAGNELLSTWHKEIADECLGYFKKKHNLA